MPLNNTHKSILSVLALCGVAAGGYVAFSNDRDRPALSPAAAAAQKRNEAVRIRNAVIDARTDLENMLRRDFQAKGLVDGATVDEFMVKAALMTEGYIAYRLERSDTLSAAYLRKRFRRNLSKTLDDYFSAQPTYNNCTTGMSYNRNGWFGSHFPRDWDFNNIQCDAGGRIRNYSQSITDGLSVTYDFARQNAFYRASGKDAEGLQVVSFAAMPAQERARAEEYRDILQQKLAVAEQEYKHYIADHKKQILAEMDEGIASYPAPQP